MVTITGFADEISQDFVEQLEVLQSEQLNHIEFRSAWGTNVLKLTDEQLDIVKNELIHRNVNISSIGSPIGKINIKDDFESHLNDFERAIVVAKKFNVPYIRLFSFFIPDGENPSSYRDEVINRMKELVRRAEAADIVLLHENEKKIYGDNAERCLNLLQECSSPHLKMAFDPANFVQCGVQPYSEAFPVLKDYIEYIHIKDALFENKMEVPAGEGDGQLIQIIKELQQAGYSGYMSIEPHLKARGKLAGMSQPQLYVTAVKALKKILEQLNYKYN